MISAKQQLRTQMRNKRRSLTSQQRQQAADSALAVFRNWVTDDMFPMAFYLGFDAELDPTAMIEWCWSQQKSVYLPLVTPNQPTLTFAQYDRNTEVVANQFGILQPVVENHVKASTLQTIIMPLTAFDLNGARLGMGGGYYDATLAEIDKRPTLIGLAYHFQQLDHCPMEAHDQALDGVLTDELFIDFSYHNGS